MTVRRIEALAPSALLEVLLGPRNSRYYQQVRVLRFDGLCRSFRVQRKRVTQVAELYWCSVWRDQSSEFAWYAHGPCLSGTTPARRRLLEAVRKRYVAILTSISGAIDTTLKLAQGVVRSYDRD